MEIKDTEYRLSNAVQRVDRDVCNGVPFGLAVESSANYWQVTIKSVLAEYQALVDMRMIRSVSPKPDGDPQ